ncbi:BHLH domain-containing protein [Psidium guajava]|nr:BHLH domain-containing protein [Psidium guajava]
MAAINSPEGALVPSFATSRNHFSTLVMFHGGYVDIYVGAKSNRLGPLTHGTNYLA